MWVKKNRYSLFLHTEAPPPYTRIFVIVIVQALLLCHTNPWLNGRDQRTRWSLSFIPLFASIKADFGIQGKWHGGPTFDRRAYLWHNQCAHHIWAGCSERSYYPSYCLDMLHHVKLRLMSISINMICMHSKWLVHVPGPTSTLDTVFTLRFISTGTCMTYEHSK